MIQLMDTDDDQKVSVDEIKAEHKRMIAGSDIDGDGKLDVKEFKRRGWMFRRPPTTTLFDLLDADGDQTLSAEEISAPSERWFKRYDANNDGQIEAAELPQYGRRDRHERRGRDDDERPRGSGMRDGGGPR
jgi:hypothetical protein